jgi:ABC-type Zn uptake system ZnuABC Zn-binding protein ZnuA
LTVVTTNSILDDLLRQVAGDWVESKVLVGANGDPHTFEPTPRDNVILKKADLIFENGLHLEPWMDKLYAASESKALRIKVTEGLPLLTMQSENESIDHANSSEHSESDPHVWHDVTNIYKMVQTIKEALVKAEPVHANEFQTNADRYTSQLKELDSWITKQVALIPETRRKLVTSHDTFGYFARRYGFQVIGAVVDSATTEAADPSAMKMVSLVWKIKSSQVPSIFVENVANPQMVEAVAKEAGVKVAPALYSDALGAKGSPAENYIGMMRYNVKTIVEALK